MTIQLRAFLITAAALAAVSCSAEPEPAKPLVIDPPGQPAATPEAEIARLRAENAKLREQLTGAKQEMAVSQNKVAVVEAKQKNIEAGKLEVGMTVQEANKAVNGDPHLYKDTCQLLSQTDSEWTYRILSAAPAGGPGSGGAAPVGVNMRGDRPTPVEAWLCTFDAKTGKLKSFHRDFGK